MCGSRKIRRVRRDVKIDVGQLHFIVPAVGFDECPQCGEQFFDLAAMEKIEAHRPTTVRPKIRRRSA
jgi:YgiT-type zinc finger domain-containing protein